MRIDIALKLRPFSHNSGTICLIPYSTWQVQVFVSRLYFTNLAGLEKKGLDLPIEGPVKGFTVMQDLQKGSIEVFGRGPHEYFHYTLTAGQLSFKQGETIALPFIKKVEIPPLEKKVSFGVHKKQDWEQIRKRSDCAEFFPFWVRLAQLIPFQSLPKEPLGTMLLLKEGRLDLFFEAGFCGLLSPRFQDEHYLGLVPDVTTDFCPLGLLHEGARQIEALFFQEEGISWHFLPALPKELHAGRWTGLETKEGHQIDFEWSKKTLKKVIIHPLKDSAILLKLPSQLKTFRLRTQLRQKGKVLKCGESLAVREGQTIFLDRFCK